MSNDNDALQQSVLISMDDIDADEDFNCRGAIPSHSVLDLVEDVKTNGLMYPVHVRRWSDKSKKFNGKTYALVVGFRRFTAFRVLEKEQIPAVIEIDVDENTARIKNLKENLFRVDLNILQEAKALNHFIGFYTDQQIGKMFNQSRGWAQCRRNLLALPEPIQLEAAAGMINQAHIKQIFSLPEAEQYEAVRKIKEAKLAGEKPRKSLKKQSPHTRRCRDQSEMFQLQDSILERMNQRGFRKISDCPTGVRMAMRMLGWTSGEVSDEEIQLELKEAFSEKTENSLSESSV